jgi:prepilin-type N-terminal cleavage/methylation domain-containing protein
MFNHRGSGGWGGEGCRPAVDHIRQVGFSLLEMVLVLTLVAILAGAGARGVAAGFDAYLSARAVAPLADRGRLAMERIMVELRGASCSSLSRPGGSDSLQMTSNQDRLLVFTYSETEIDTLIMTVDGGGEQILLQGVTEFGFEIGSNCVVSINMTLSGTMNGGGVLSLPLRSSIYVGGS